MKRCPTCNRVETDEALTYCRVDGAALISDSGSVGGDAGAGRVGPPPASSEIETSVLPHRTDAGVNHPTAPTTVLPASATPVTTSELTKSKRRGVLFGLIAVAVLGSAIGSYFYFLRKTTPAIQSIAVMPFVNESSNTDLDYLSDGMTETLIRSLSQLPNLSVKARSSVFRYKGRESETKTIGRELGVPVILNGRFTQRGDQLTLNLELVDAVTEDVIWTDQYDRKSSDLVALQNQIARDVTSKLRIQLTSADQLKLAKNYTNDPEVYRLYEKLQELDPTFPWAHSFLSRVYTWNGDDAAAAEEFAKSVELNGNPDDAKLLRQSFASGNEDAFRRVAVRQDTRRRLYASPYSSVEAFRIVSNADKEAAIKLLTEGANRGDFWTFLIKTDPQFDPLRGDPRFEALVKRFDPPK